MRSNFGRFGAKQSDNRESGNFRWIELPIPLRASRSEMLAAFPPMAVTQFHRLVLHMCNPGQKHQIAA
jgi:hypothetical protein